MKRLIVTMSVAMSAVSVAAVVESFDYPVTGPVAGQSGGTGLSGSWSLTTIGSTEVKAGNTYTDSLGASLLVSGGSADLITDNTTARLSRSLETPYTSGIVYGSILINHFVETSSLDAGFAVGNVGLYWRGWSSNWVLGEGGNNFSTVPKPAEGDVDLMVFAIDIDNDTLSVWKNPDLGIEDTPDYTTSIDPVTSIDSLEIWQQGADENNHPQQTVLFDEFRLGTSFAEVTPIPEPTTALLGFVGLLTCFSRRRK
ncbi:hypothetical protein [Roseibacillus persicicus]|nr:hypothetical protein [Roseibacillus persicicus]